MIRVRGMVRVRVIACGAECDAKDKRKEIISRNQLVVLDNLGVVMPPGQMTEFRVG
jgi:hypothetical protein